MWCNWCISTGRRFLACALRVGDIQPTRMELFQHIQQRYSFASGSYWKKCENTTRVWKYENDALWDTVTAVRGEMTQATTSPSSNEIIANQKDGCNLRDSTRCFVKSRYEASSWAFSSACCLETGCDKRGLTEKPHVSITSHQPMSKPCTRLLSAVCGQHINMWPHNISAPPVEMVVGSALIQGFKTGSTSLTVLFPESLNSFTCSMFLSVMWSLD